ncbi:polysaccharide deacetylase family protein [Streptomyces sp. NBC_01373]|uniref:polysaccharide deacetylase family protein n=1 Tax=unclassified Streptomyces TaxID=2593676 RepID=UPI00224CF5A3|nr:polysaccharide deacetylase family protein [Streptomyces sp. NBC_01373]MCX4700628.1 polysaccharide deacetylase family protein [Streptomyces sp. NBC_01373]
MAATVDSARATTHARPAPWVAMYHSVGDCSDDPYRITVTPERLDSQLRWLRARGLKGVSMAGLLAARARGEGDDLVGLTFDDGYADFTEHALPVLHRHGCGATLFVLPGRLGGDNAWDPLGPRKPLLTADAIRHAASEGIEIGSHGLTHVDLTTADADTLKAEVVESRAAIEVLTGTPVVGFCYPYGTVDRRALDAVREAGYSYACAIDPGPLGDRHALPRLHIGQNDTAVRLYLKYRLHRLRRRPVEGV